ncbi:V-SNARE [Cladorrhinum sp. PSN259]|nr:V-SNARE [Cladorrhinum sp. PSN259]
MSNPNALLLLADHIKLSLLERQRAKTLNLTSDSQDGHISRSLDQFQEGLDALEKEVKRQEEAGDQTKAATLSSTLTTLRKQQSDLLSQFQSSSSSNPASSSTITKPNDPSLAADFAHAQSKPSNPLTKSVRFSSPDNDADLEAQRSNLFNQPYTDNPPQDDDTAGYRDQASELTNTQIHVYHQRILDEQDAQLDTLSSSISRQRELSMQIGDELDEQVLMLDESERVADRQASALQRARRQVGRIASRQDGGENTRHMTIIVILIIILVLLIVIIK